MADMPSNVLPGVQYNPSGGLYSILQHLQEMLPPNWANRVPRDLAAEVEQAQTDSEVFAGNAAGVQEQLYNPMPRLVLPGTEGRPGGQPQTDGGWVPPGMTPFEWLTGSPPPLTITNTPIPTGEERREAEREERRAADAAPPIPPRTPTNLSPPTGGDPRPLETTELNPEEIGRDLGKGAPEEESLESYIMARLMAEGGAQKGSAPEGGSADALAESAQDLRQNRWETMARFGFALAAGQSPFLAENIGNAGIAALDARDEGFRDYQAAIQDMYTLQEQQRANMASEDNQRTAIMTELYKVQQAGQGGEDPLYEIRRDLLFKEVDAILGGALSESGATTSEDMLAAIMGGQGYTDAQRRAISGAMVRSGLFPQELIDRYLNTTVEVPDIGTDTHPPE